MLTALESGDGHVQCDESQQLARGNVGMAVGAAVEWMEGYFWESTSIPKVCGR